MCVPTTTLQAPANGEHEPFGPQGDVSIRFPPHGGVFFLRTDSQLEPGQAKACLDFLRLGIRGCGRQLRPEFRTERRRAQLCNNMKKRAVRALAQTPGSTGRPLCAPAATVTAVRPSVPLGTDLRLSLCNSNSVSVSFCVGVSACVLSSPKSLRVRSVAALNGLSWARLSLSTCLIFCVSFPVLHPPPPTFPIPFLLRSSQE